MALRRECVAPLPSARTSTAILRRQDRLELVTSTPALAML